MAALKAGRLVVQLVAQKDNSLADQKVVARAAKMDVNWAVYWVGWKVAQSAYE